MAKHAKPAKMNIPMCVACVLFCLTLFSFHLMGGLYAKYTTHGSASDSARVAKFEITETETSFSTDLVLKTTPGEEVETITVSNKSEVVVEYIVTVENTTRNIPYHFKINDSEKTFGSCTVTCYLEPNSTSEVKISAIWDKENALPYMGMVDLITVSIVAQQLD